MDDIEELHRLPPSAKRPRDIIKPNALRDLHFELGYPDDLSDADFRRIVTRWLGKVNHAEYAPTDQWVDLKHG